MPEIVSVILFSLIAAVVTGLGVVPLKFVDIIPKRLMNLSGAFVSGMLLAAAFSLINEGIKSSTPLTAAGIILGLILIILNWKYFDSRNHPGIADLPRANALKSIIILGVMTAHSFAEGIAIGLSFGNTHTFGLLISVIIALHNIPEGLAIGIVLVQKGVKVWKAGFWAIFTSLPQPLTAAAAFLLAGTFKPFLPLGLGIAAGAIVWIIGSEVLPDACGDTQPQSIGTAMTIGVAVMLLFQFLI